MTAAWQPGEIVAAFKDLCNYLGVPPGTGLAIGAVAVLLAWKALDAWGKRAK